MIFAVVNAHEWRRARWLELRPGPLPVVALRVAVGRGASALIHEANSSAVAAVLLCLIAAGGAAAAAASPGDLVSAFGGLPFAVAPGSLSGPLARGSGYRAGDTVTLQCPGVSFKIAPIVAVAATGGAVTNGRITNPGQIAGPVPGGGVTCRQAATSGGGSGYAVTVRFGPIAADLSIASLGTGGDAGNGNFFLTQESPSAAFAGSESTLVGDRAGGGAGAGASAITAYGHNACGVGPRPGAIPPYTGSYITCVGGNAGRDLTGAAKNDTFLGFGAGGAEGTPTGPELISGGGNTCTGSATCDRLGGSGGNTINGFHSGTGAMGGFNSVTGANSYNGSGAGNTIICSDCAKRMIGSGHDNVVLSSGRSGCDVLTANADNSVVVCAGSPLPVISTTGGNSPATSMTTVAGRLTVAALPTSGPIGGVLCATSAGIILYERGASTCTVSSRALKRDIAGLTGGGALAAVMDLRPVAFNWRRGDAKRRIGFIAEDVRQADPRLATYDGSGQLQGYDPNGVLAAAVAVVQQQQREIWALYAILAMLAAAVVVVYCRCRRLLRSGA
jgi:hypothetical protein